MGKQWKRWQTLFFGGSKISADGDCSHEIKRRLLLGRKVMTNLDSISKSRAYFVNKDPSSQGYGFSSVHVWMWDLDYKESWAQKNWCFWTVVLEKTVESPLNCKEIEPVHPKGDQSWVFIGRTNVEAETSILWSPDGKSWLIGQDPDAGKDWGQEEKGMTEDEMVGWHHWLDGYLFGWTLGIGDGQKAWHAAVHGVTKSQTLLREWTDWTDIILLICCLFIHNIKTESMQAKTIILYFWDVYVCLCINCSIHYLTHCDPMDCSQPGSSLHGIL